jgi:KipI family sensor histidine kinase inhibitor
MEWQAYGDQGVLLNQLQPGFRSSLIARFEKTLPKGCQEFVIGYESILLVGSVAELSPLAETLQADCSSHGTEGTPPNRGPIRKIPVRYDGPDLQAVAEQCGVTVPELIAIHSDPTYTVHMMGFAPGFPYLSGLDARLHLERRSSPRNHIQPGTVAIGGPHAGIYPVASPGGWHLLGHSEQPLFNPAAAQKPELNLNSIFTLKPGDRVRFQAVEPSA